ncbi:MAG: tetratricopeptide repeat protein [Ignavibacteriaceae bacterium]
MSSWYPNAETYSEHLSKNSYIRDINGQIMKTGNSIQDKISKQTYELVASQEQLSKAFGVGFNSMNETLDWGFNQLENTLQDINASIDSLHSDFVYGIGLLLTQMQTQNKLLSDLIDKIDAIHKTLQSPTLTKAREYYRLGCERLQKGLLDKALEAFLEAEKHNDTDFFTQFNIGLLFLYGIDDDDNVLDLKKAEQHLLLATRYAKAEIITDPSFAKLAAEALFNASLSIYFQLGDKQFLDDHEKSSQLLKNCIKLASEAVKLNPHLAEGFYHIAIYSALIKDIPNVDINLNKAITIDRNYAIKVGQNHAFDGVRSNVNDLLSKLKSNVEKTANLNIKNINKLLNELSNWHPEKSPKLQTTFINFKDVLSMAIYHSKFNTYFGFLDAIHLLNKIINEIPRLESERYQELNELLINKIYEIRNILPSVKNYYTQNIIEDIETIQISLLKYNKNYNFSSYDSYQQVFTELDSIKIKVLAVKKLAKDEDLQKQRIENELSARIQEEADRNRKSKEEKEENVARQKRRNNASKSKAGIFATFGGIIGFISGMVSCFSMVPNEAIARAGNPFIYAFWGVIIGAIIGAIIGQTKD